MELVASGLSNQQIAAELFVSINTVKSYIRSAYERIGAQTRSQAVLWAVRHGVGPPAQLRVVAPPEGRAAVAGDGRGPSSGGAQLDGGPMLAGGY